MSVSRELNAAGVNIRVMSSAIKRAFELAPDCRTLTELRQRLSMEGYGNLQAHIGGRGTQRQLKVLFNNGQGALKTGPKKEPVS